GEGGVHVPPRAVPGDTLVDLIHQFINQPSASPHAHHRRPLGHLRVARDSHPAVLFEESRRSAKIPGAVYRMADPADILIGGDLHATFGHLHGRPELILITVAIGKINHRAFVAIGGRLYRVAVRDLMLIEPA